MTDAEIARAYRDRVYAAYEVVGAILDEARSAGFEIGFQAGPGPDGKTVIQSLKVMKVL